jgi:hypothetical protein
MILVIHASTLSTASPGDCLCSNRQDRISAGLNSNFGTLAANSFASRSTFLSSSTSAFD